jgi:hypothetical protein
MQLSIAYKKEKEERKSEDYRVVEKRRMQQRKCPWYPVSTADTQDNITNKEEEDLPRRNAH